MDRAGHLRMKGVTLVFVFVGKGARDGGYERGEAGAANPCARAARLGGGFGQGLAPKDGECVEWRAVSKVIDDLREAGFVDMFAPFEAGEQLAHMCKEGIVGRGVDVGTFVVANFKFQHILHAHTLPTRIGGFAS